MKDVDPINGPCYSTIAVATRSCLFALQSELYPSPLARPSIDDMFAWLPSETPTRKAMELRAFAAALLHILDVMEFTAVAVFFALSQKITYSPSHGIDHPRVYH